MLIIPKSNKFVKWRFVLRPSIKDVYFAPLLCAGGFLHEKEQTEKTSDVRYSLENEKIQIILKLRQKRVISKG